MAAFSVSFGVNGLFLKFAALVARFLQASLMVHDPRNNTNGPRTYTKKAFCSCHFVLCFGVISWIVWLTPASQC